MSPQPRVAVVGAGVIGLSTAYALLERGVSVRIYEQGVAGNRQSGGESRIFRHAHDDRRLVALAQRSREAYDEWSERLGVPLVSPDGAVALGPATTSRLALLREAGVAARPIDAAELAAAVPPLAGFDGPAMLDERGGSIRTTAMVRALCTVLGERLVTDEVLTVRPVDNATVEIRSGGRTDRYERAVVAAGRDTPRFARDLGLSLPVRHGAHVRLTFTVDGAPPSRLATLQDSSDTFGESGVYAAAVPDNTAYCVGLSQASEARDDGSQPDTSALARLADRAERYVRRALPGLNPHSVDARHCWVTTLPWSDDGLAVWEQAGVLMVAGHNLFKHAPGLGRLLAAAADGHGTDPLLSPDATLGRG